MLVSEAFERYRQDRIVFANKSSKTEEQNIYTLKSLLRYLGSDRLLSELDFETIRKWKLDMEHRNLVSGTVRGYIVNLRSVLKYARLIGEDCIDPELIIIPKRVDRPPSFLSSDEVTKLITTIRKTPNCSATMKARNMAIVSMLYASGIRIAELCAINRDDLYGNEFTVFGKGQKSRVCFIDDRTKEYLSKYLRMRTDTESALFTDGINGGRLKVKTLQGLFRRLNAKSVVQKPIHAHTLRHSYATNLLRNGCHIYTLSRLMGHSNIATTQAYLHIHDAELSEAYSKFHTV